MKKKELVELLENFPDDTILLYHVGEGKFVEVELENHGIYDVSEQENGLTDGKFIEMWPYNGGPVLSPVGKAVNLTLLTGKAPD